MKLNLRDQLHLGNAVLLSNEAARSSFNLGSPPLQRSPSELLVGGTANFGGSFKNPKANAPPAGFPANE